MERRQGRHDMPKLSILLPTYNGGAYLAEQLETILGQTDGDFELLAIDDGSSDDTVDVLDAFAARDTRMSRLSATGNTGQNARLVELLGHARGDFIAVADQDDRWAPDRNAVLLDAVGDRQMAFGRSELIDKNGDPMGRSLLDLLYGDHHSSEPLFSLIQPMFSAHAMIVRRDLVGTEAFFHALPFDWLVALEAMFGGGAVYRDDAVVFHRLHDSNQCNSMTSPDQGSTQSNLRCALFFRLPARLRLVAVFDYLGRCTRIIPQWRKKFQMLARHCQFFWFSEWRSLRSNDAGLRKLIVTTLAPHAGSERDLHEFERYIAVLTGPAFGPAMIGEVRRRLRVAGSR